MCLYVVLKHHPLSSRTPESRERMPTHLVAEEDLLVFKVLEGHKKYAHETEYFWVSPFMGTHYLLGEPTESVVEFDMGEAMRDQWVIEEGLHAYVFGSAEQTLEFFFSRTSNDPKYAAFPAIIPKGTSFYVGDRCDVVATKLIVYKDMAHLRSRHRDPSLALYIGDTSVRDLYPDVVAILAQAAPHV